MRIGVHNATRIRAKVRECERCKQQSRDTDFKVKSRLGQVEYSPLCMTCRATVRRESAADERPRARCPACGWWHSDGTRHCTSCRGVTRQGE